MKRTCVAVLLAASAATAGAAIDATRALQASRAAIGSQPAPHAFTDTTGRRVTLADFRGRPLVVSFVYTGCSQVCPVATRALARAVREGRAALGDDAFGVVSIGFDIPADNPMSLKVFAARNGVDDARWAFLTPDPGVPEAVARDFGFAFEPAAGGLDHLTQVTVLDARGRIQAQVNGETFAVPMLVQPLREALLGAPPRLEGVDAAIERVRLLCTVYDPLTGKYRLDYALFIELAVGIVVLGATLGFVVRERRRARRSAC